MDSSVRESFHQGDNSFVAVARKVEDQKALVVAFDLSDTAQSKGHALRDIGLAGQVTLRTGPLRLDFLVEEVVAGVRDDVCRVTQQVESTAPITIDADYGLLRQALDTLARNAVARATSVEVSARGVGDRCLITVDDDVPGIPPDLLPVVFDRFRRGDTKGGAGLGMAIAKRIVEMHHGTVTAENRETGGARVTLDLPVGTS